MQLRDDFPEIDTTVASAARMYDYVLGGTDNFPVDRQAAEAAEELWPGIHAQFRANRRFLERLVRYLVAECGIRQFLDFGSGLPTQNNVHQVARTVSPDVRVVYVDNDPIVLRHGSASASLTGDQGTAFILEDLCDVAAICGHPETVRLIDFSEPVAVLYLAVLHLVPDERDPWGAVRSMMDRTAPGSYLAISHGSTHDQGTLREVNAHFGHRSGPRGGFGRDTGRITEFYDGLELVEPGLVQVSDWRTSGETLQTQVFLFGGVGRKPASLAPAPAPAQVT